MYDASKVVTGLIVFLGIAAFPVTYGIAGNLADVKAGQQVVSNEKQCVEPADYMRAQHMRLLGDWRESVVRANQRQYIASDGRKYDISLSNTCMKCHSNKTQFCDRCHSYLGVEPNCWNCHVAPIEEKSR